MITAKRFSAEGQVQARRLSTEGKKLDDIAKVVGSPSSVVSNNNLDGLAAGMDKMAI